MDAGTGKVLKVAGYTIHISSVGGIATSCYIQELDIAFDIGIPFKKSYTKSNVFITHAHYDHISGIVSHAGRRSLLSLSCPSYHVPQAIANDVQNAMRAFCNVLQGDSNINFRVVPMEVGKKVSLPQRIEVIPFSTVHRVESLGYCVYRNITRLKAEYRKMKGKELQELKKTVEINEKTRVMEFAYTGDTDVSVFSLHPEILEAKVLIMELTFLGSRVSEQKAIDTGHIHLNQVARIAHNFRNQHVVFMHVSARFKASDVYRELKQVLPKDFVPKYYVASP